MSNLLKEHSKPIAQGVVGGLISALLLYGGAVVIGWYSAHSAYISGKPLYWAISLGVLTFLAVAVGINFISLAIARHRSPKSERGEQLSVTNNCPDKWLHDIADKQEKEIHWRIEVLGLQVSRHEFMRDSPYIEFNFTVENGSLYPVCLCSLGGSIYFQNRLLNGKLRWTDSSPKNIPPLEMLPFVELHQELSKEDVISILNNLGENTSFNFSHLEVGINSPEHPKVKPQFLRMFDSEGNKELLMSYPKLNIEIQQTQLVSHWTKIDPNDYLKGDVIGSVVNIYVRFKNPRQMAVDIQNFKLDTAPLIARVTPAESGKIYELPHFKDVLAGVRLDNLNNCPIHAEQGHPFEGWLQFVISGVQPEILESSTPTLIIEDVFGEKHPQVCPPLVRGRK
ncbi:MAG: hypothetical protein WCB68_21525 [Pyrinomonadaceae bacterium]